LVCSDVLVSGVGSAHGLPNAQEEGEFDEEEGEYDMQG